MEHSPSKVAATDQPFTHLSSAEAEVKAASRARAAPLTTKDAPGSVWKVAPMLRPGLKPYAQAARPRSVTTASVSAKGLSVRRPSSLQSRQILLHRAT